MARLTDEGRRVVDSLAQRHGFSSEAIEQMLTAVLNGNGQMAQFGHSEFGGSGQWMRGGMTMIGDMFNNSLKGRVDSLCADIATHLNNAGGLMQSGSFQSQSQSGTGSQSQAAGGLRGESSLFVPDPDQNWWPKELGQPNATGSQNQTRYAYFSIIHRLAVKTGGSVWVYDTLEHQIGGFSQQQSGSGSITFSSQYGTVDLSSLPIVMQDGQVVVKKQVLSANSPVIDATIPTAPVDTTPSPDSTQEDIFAKIEKLGDLKSKGLLTDEEFNEKKKELLARL